MWIQSCFSRACPKEDFVTTPCSQTPVYQSTTLKCTNNCVGTFTITNRHFLYGICQFIGCFASSKLSTQYLITQLMYLVKTVFNTCVGNSWESERVELKHLLLTSKQLFPIKVLKWAVLSAPVKSEKVQQSDFYSFKSLRALFYTDTHTQK